MDATLTFEEISEMFEKAGIEVGGKAENDGSGRTPVSFKRRNS